MAKLKIFTYPDLVLTKKAVPIARVDQSYFKLADDMLETMYEAPGIGLAANQVGIAERLLVLDVEYEVEDDDLDSGLSSVILATKKPIVIFNPQIVWQEGKASFNEGCLSVPEYTAEVKRSAKIRVEYVNIDGLTKTLDAEGLLAVALQHEMDHLEGRLFIDRLSPLKKELARKRLVKERSEREARELKKLKGF